MVCKIRFMFTCSVIRHRGNDFTENSNLCPRSFEISLNASQKFAKELHETVMQAF